ncbi:efflux RND transporter permease subunit [Radiobacillus kanasensis]|uniref:efflux RND transporter permease subunit n=1 Tax=Radiobacillus kanasensis TaxID=2844358 RepID=UPI001E642199|nr:efflux RND transporter permease subunit [Radiobacillus kanasensis]UFU00632.1 efflux RND transporter permease subunit [Radiobacillus kanasensis]
MKKIIDFSLNNKFAIWLLTIMVTAAGLYAGLNMKQETMPNITLPNVSIITTYPGAAPGEVAEEVTEPIEQRVQNLSGVELVSSSSMANASSVQIQFDFDTNMDNAEDEVKDVLEDLSLPEGVSDPEVSRLSLNAFPVMALSVSNPDLSLEELTTEVEGNVLPVLEGVDGVADVQISGQQVQEVSMKFNQDALTQYGLTEDTVKQIIQGSKVSFPLGLTNFDGEVKNLVIDGNVATVEDFKNIQIPITPSQSAPQGQAGTAAQGAQTAPQANQQAPTSMELPTVALEDLAEIEVISESESISRTNGEESIGIQIVKASDANTVEVVNGVKDEIADFEENLGLTVTSTLDQGEPIEESVSTMLNKALFGALFAVIIILLFLRSIKTTLISVISIPLSLLMAVLILHQMDITLNIMTLGALTVAIGRVIDDSIVVIENIYRRMALSDEKLTGKELIREATREMFIPISSSTIVTIAVFLPLGLVSGQVGEMFLPFALAVVFALLASLLVAVTIVPMLAHSLFKKRLAQKSVEATATHEEKPSKLANFYKKILDWALSHKWITFGGAVVVLVASLFLVPVIGVSFLPSDEQKMVIATYSPEPGQTKEDVQEIATTAEEYFGDRDGVTTYQYSIGNGGSMSMMGMGSDNSALFFVEYADDYENFSEESTTVIDHLNEVTDKGEWGTIDIASTGGSSLELIVYGDTIEEIQTAVDQILPVLEERDDLENAESSLSEAYDQYTLVANQEKLSQYGLTAAQIGMNLRSTGDAPVLTTVQHDGEDINVYVEVEEKTYESIDEIKDTEIQTPLGTSVKIEDVMDVEEGKSPDTISRRNGDMYASLSADVLSSDVAAVSAEVDEKVQDLDLEDVRVEFGGVTEQINESFTQLGLAMLAAIAIVYFVLVVTFGGALAPFAILFSLPFTVIGGLVALWIANEPLSVSAMIGALMLIGIVVTNAIVLIDRVIHKEKEGLSTREALLEAGATRLRPILMTAIATVGALIPLAIGAEGGGLISKGLGVTVIGGLISSTLLTLVIVPIVYEVFAKFRKKKEA